jgi:hypothetical protein
MLFTSRIFFAVDVDSSCCYGLLVTVLIYYNVLFTIPVCAHACAAVLVPYPAHNIRKLMFDALYMYIVQHLNI